MCDIGSKQELVSATQDERPLRVHDAPAWVINLLILFDRIGELLMSCSGGYEAPRRVQSTLQSERKQSRCRTLSQDFSSILEEYDSLPSLSSSRRTSRGNPPQYEETVNDSDMYLTIQDGQVTRLSQEPNLDVRAVVPIFACNTSRETCHSPKLEQVSASPKNSDALNRPAQEIRQPKHEELLNVSSPVIVQVAEEVVQPVQLAGENTSEIKDSQGPAKRERSRSKPAASRRVSSDPVPQQVAQLRSQIFKINQDKKLLQKQLEQAELSIKDLKHRLHTQITIVSMECYWISNCLHRMGNSGNLFQSSLNPELNKEIIESSSLFV